MGRRERDRKSETQREEREREGGRERDCVLTDLSHGLPCGDECS